MPLSEGKEMQPQRMGEVFGALWAVSLRVEQIVRGTEIPRSPVQRCLKALKERGFAEELGGVWSLVDRPRPRYGFLRTRWLEREARRIAWAKTQGDLLHLRPGENPVQVAVENLKQARREYLRGP